MEEEGLKTPSRLNFYVRSLTALGFEVPSWHQWDESSQSAGLAQSVRGKRCGACHVNGQPLNASLGITGN